MGPKPPAPRASERTLEQTLALALWMGGYHLNVALLMAELYWSPHPVALACLAVHIASCIWPGLSDTPPAWGRRLAEWIVQSAQNGLPATLELEDAAAFTPGRPYLIGLEPHGVLPLSLVHFGNGGRLLPPALAADDRRRAFASSVIFNVPFVRVLWSWLGLRPASRTEIVRHLNEGRVCILVPGGVQEVLHMRHDAEVLYLKNRLGFVRLALQHGAPLVPAFAFGQCHMYSWSRPGPPLVPRAAVALVSRLVGFCPIMFWGRQGGPLPHRTPVHVVVGSPIVVPHVKDPSREQCQKYLDLFIAAMETLFEQHKRKVPTSIQTLKVI